MVEEDFNNDTIVAISTAIGFGGIGIVRLSGPQAVSIADRMFQSRNGKRPSDFETHTVHYGTVIDEQYEIIDEVLLTLMRAPRSYTREDVVELSCHGGVVAIKTILSLAIRLGARLAGPGEFTKRGFLNGRIDLTQAEAVQDIIQSKTEAFLRISAHQLKGELSCELESIREILMEVYAGIEAVINFPEDDIDTRVLDDFKESLLVAEQRVEQLLRTSEQGLILKEGIKAVICGKPNVGKSSLLNLLLRQPRAIVSEIAGTTRDTIEESAQINGIPMVLVDTAGILEPRDLIEKEAVKRSHLHIEGADVVLFVLDGSQSLSGEDQILLKKVRQRNTFVLINKIDLPQKIFDEDLLGSFPRERIFSVCVTQKSGIQELQEAVVASVLHGKVINSQGFLLSNTRQIESLQSCGQELRKISSVFEDHLSLEFASEGIKAAVNDLDRITGRSIEADMLDKIFDDFCIGK